MVGNFYYGNFTEAIFNLNIKILNSNSFSFFHVLKEIKVLGEVQRFIS